METPTIKETESLHLDRNAKGLYSWEIKILNIDVERLAQIDAELIKKFGSPLVL